MTTIGIDRVAVESLTVGATIRIPGDVFPVRVTELVQYVDGYTVYYVDVDGKTSFLPVDLGTTFPTLDWSAVDFDSFVKFCEDGSL